MAGMNRSLLPLATALLHATTAAPASEAGTLPALPRTAMSVDHPATGFHAGTGNEHESRPALSLIKLYLADYVLSHGDPADAEKARHMVRTSDDATASELQARYPGAIRHTADYYGLRATTEAPHWGNSTTSTADVTAFPLAKQRQNPQDPVLVEMTQAAPVTADGYPQDFGTATLPGVTGTKFGWSDDRTSIHASASIGPDLVVSAHTWGTAAEHTADVQAAPPADPVRQARDTFNENVAALRALLPD